MPRDVSTRWNSTYDMLKFAYLYREAIDKITGDRAMKLREYELLESEWETVKHLRDSLKVRFYIFYYLTTVLIQLLLDFQDRHTRVLNRHTLRCDCNSCDGQNAYRAHHCRGECRVFTSVTSSINVRKKSSQQVLLPFGWLWNLPDRNRYVSFQFIATYRLSNYTYLVLHPKYKLKYFEKQNWEEDWIKTAEEIVREEFKKNYEEYLPRKSKTSQSYKKKVRISKFFNPFIVVKSPPVPPR